MSFSFSVTGKDKASVLDAANAQMDTIIGTQPNHKHDRDAISMTIGIYVDLLPEFNPPRVLHVSASGSLGWEGSQEEPTYNGAGVSVSVRAVPA